MKKRRIRQCVLRTGRKPVSCRWRDINTGDSERVEVRSRSIAREIKQKGTDIYFAGTRWRHFVQKVGTDVGWLAQSMCVRTRNTRFGHGCAW